MSNKKRRNRKTASDSFGSGLTKTAGIETSRNQSGVSTSQFVETNSSGGKRLLAYLKANLWMVAFISFLALSALGTGLKYLDEDAQWQMQNGKRKTENNQQYLRQNWI